MSGWRRNSAPVVKKPWPRTRLTLRRRCATMCVPTGSLMFKWRTLPPVVQSAASMAAAREDRLASLDLKREELKTKGERASR